MEFEHVSVLLKESIEGLRIKPSGIYVDGTLGGGGHSYEIAKALGSEGRLIGVDQDGDAIEAAGERLSPFSDRTSIVRSNYREIPEILRSFGIEGADGILLDLGVSSHQLDDESRGFTYRTDAPLDMRMDVRREKTAADLLNTAEETELYHILRDYGEEKFAKNIAKHICIRRREKLFQTTGELVEIVERAIPAKARRGGGHPAKRTFQAIRIAVNRELEVLEDSLDAMIDLLNPGGRLCIITFHSLEDRIVKNNFRKNENPCTCPPSFPVCVCGKEPKGRVVTRKPILPSEEEIERNKRAKSAKLRIFEKK